jgi:hypothetical protein
MYYSALNHDFFFFPPIFQSFRQSSPAVRYFTVLYIEHVEERREDKVIINVKGLKVCDDILIQFLTFKTSISLFVFI